MGRDIKNRAVFDSAAEFYDKYRPHYPEDLFNDLVNKTHLTSAATILEIGPGTGQATTSMAKRGYNITAVELGEELAKIAKQNLSVYPNVKITVGSFENTPLADNHFDLVYSATAFHWIGPKFRYQKTYEISKPNGYLAIIQTNHVSDNNGDKLFIASQPIYDKYLINNDSKTGSLPQIKDLEPTSDLDKKLFRLVSFDCYPLVITYSAEDYANLLGTHSPQLALPRQARESFLREIRNLIKTEFNGSFTKHYSMSLTLAQKI